MILPTTSTTVKPSPVLAFEAETAPKTPVQHHGRNHPKLAYALVHHHDTNEVWRKVVQAFDFYPKETK